MSDIIRLLPDSVANQIAAGEVIQRPASAVKELMENSIDAGATDIKLIIKDAGKTLIQVIDNGCGMSEIDARMSFERYATSKIKQAKDLFAIHTLGFRGEALASIAAIAQVEMKTKKIEDELGTYIEIEGSKIKNQSPCNCPDGTSVSVKNLFFNVPARRNFLKSNNAETRHIIEEFQRIVLGAPDISFSMFNNNRIIFKINKSNLKQRIVATFGNNYNERLIPVKLKTNFIKISGFIGKPEYAKKTRGEQYFFVNNRFIKHPYLNHAVNNAYQELIPKEAFPSYFIYFDVAPKTIDININPTKIEVNFQDNTIIYSILRSAIKYSLGKYSITPTIDFNIEQSVDLPPDYDNKPVKQPSVHINPDYNPFNIELKNKFINKESSRTISNKKNWYKLFEKNKEGNSNELENNIKIINQQEDQPIKQISEKNIFEKTNNNILQLQNHYILTNIKSGLIIIDQQKAHERILYERFIDIFKSKKSISQQQLFPQSITFTASDAELIRGLKKEIQTLGFVINELQNKQNTFVINGAPADIPDENIKELLEKIIENYKKNQTINTDKKINLALSTARNMAIKPGKKLQIEEMKTLINELFTCKIPDVSPDGEPTLTIISTDELDKRFK